MEILNINQTLSDSASNGNYPESTQINHCTLNFEDTNKYSEEQYQPTQLKYNCCIQSIIEEQSFQYYLQENNLTLSTNCSSKPSFIEESNSMDYELDQNNFSTIFEDQMNQNYQQVEKEFNIIDCQITNEGQIIYPDAEEPSWQQQPIQEENQLNNEEYHQNPQNQEEDEEKKMVQVEGNQPPLPPNNNHNQNQSTRTVNEYIFPRCKNRKQRIAISLWIISYYLQNKKQLPFSYNQIIQIFGRLIGDDLYERMILFRNQDLKDNNRRKKPNKKYIDFVCAEVIGISHKTIQDYQTQIKKGIFFNYPFQNAIQSNFTMGHLRKYIKQKEVRIVYYGNVNTDINLKKERERVYQQHIRKFFQNNNIEYQILILQQYIV